MTTIAYDHINGFIAVDGRVTSSGVIQSDNACKVINANGRTFCMSGSTSDWNDFCNDFENGKQPKRKYSCNAMMIENESVFTCGIDDDDGLFFQCEQNWNSAMGSGNQFAVAAMDFGKSAEEAVKYASTKDCYTGGKITVIKTR